MDIDSSVKLNVGYVDLPNLPRNHSDFQNALCLPDSYMYLVINPYLTKDELLFMFKNSKEPYVLNHILERTSFTDHELRSFAEQAIKDKEVQLIVFYKNLGFISSDELTEYVLNNKISRYDSNALVSIDNIHNNYDLFVHIWKSYKTVRYYLLGSMLIEKEETVPQEVYDFLEEAYLNDEMNNDSKTNYATFEQGVSEKIYEKLSQEKHREIIRELAGNPSVPVKIHWEFADKYKTPNIRESIACVTNDANLLDHIYNGTKSKGIRDAVKSNPLFEQR